MRQALHILRKDVRHLSIEIAATLLAVCGFVYTAARSPLSGWHAPLPQTVASFLITFLLPFAWWVLIVRLVHGENLIGDREFWPTRPYSWSSLLLSKLLFVAIFINLPMLIAQAVVVQAHGFSPFAELPGLLWSQLLLTLAFFLPVAAIAAITSGLAQFLVAGLVAYVAMLLLSMQFSRIAVAMVGGWGPLDWIRSYYALFVAGAGATAILLWQYARRRTLPVRVLAGAAVLAVAVGVPFSWGTAFALQSRLSRLPSAQAALRVEAHPDFRWATRARVVPDGGVAIHIPLRISGVADGVTPKVESLTATIQGAGGAVWRTPAGQAMNVTVTGQLVALQTTVDRAFYDRVKDQPVTVRGSLYVTLYGNRQETKVPFTARPTAVPGLGLCSATAVSNAPYFLTCDAVFRTQPDLVSVRFEQGAGDSVAYTPRHPLSYAPFPAQFSLDPVYPYVLYSTFKGPLDAVTVASIEPLAYVRAPLAIDGLRLADYEGARK